MVPAARLLAACRRDERWLLDTIRALVERESPTDDAAAVNRCGAELAGRLTALGARVTPIGSAASGDHLRAELGHGDRQVLLLGHFDTVWPVGELARMPLVEDGDRLAGPGVLDMKAGIALGMLATRALFDIAPPATTRVVMLWTADEETGSRTSRSLVETEARASDAVLVLEPALPDGALKTERKGIGQYELTVHGEPAHAGVDPGGGVSAIRELARQVLALETLQDLPRGISVNVGIVSGGSRPNVVAAEARAVVDVRARTMADADRLDGLLRSLTPHIPGARLSVTGSFERPPLERGPGVARLFALAQEIGREIGMPVEEGATGGGSDGNFCAALGVPTLDGLGAVGDGPHARHEHVRVSALVPRAALIAGLLAHLASR